MGTWTATCGGGLIWTHTHVSERKYPPPSRLLVADLPQLLDAALEHLQVRLFFWRRKAPLPIPDSHERFFAILIDDIHFARPKKPRKDGCPVTTNNAFPWFQTGPRFRPSTVEPLVCTEKNVYRKRVLRNFLGGGGGGGGRGRQLE